MDRPTFWPTGRPGRLRGSSIAERFAGGKTPRPRSGEPSGLWTSAGTQPKEAAMRLVDARETTVSIASNMHNAAISFARMTVSVAALVTDEVRNGRRIIGYGFNSNGRYAQGGVLRGRLIPRILESPAESLLDPDSGVLDPLRIWDAAMRDEKPGGHGERAVAMAVVDMAAWDLAAKLARLPLDRALDYAERLEPYGLAWFEEPCAPLDYAGFTRLAASYEPPLATGEN